MPDNVLPIIKRMIDLADEGQDETINDIIHLTTSRLQLLLGGVAAVPNELQYIVIEVSIRRFNRIGSEGLQSHTVEGETMTWPDNDFSPYMDDINKYLEDTDDPPQRGRVRFI